MAIRNMPDPIHMNFDELEEAAMKDKQMPKGLYDLTEQCAFFALRYLYNTWRRGMIGREQAAEEKHRLLNAFNQRKSLEEFDRKVYGKYYDMARNSDNVRNELLRKLKNNENPLYEAFVCIGEMRNDFFFLQAVEEYFKNKQPKEDSHETI